MAEKSVCMNAWAWTEAGDQEYADAAMGARHDGWSTYLRIETPDDPQQPFDIPDASDRDFTTRDEAEAFAQELAAEHGCEVQEF